jgi:general secretion pathway protein J
MNAATPVRTRCRGFTLLELLVAIAIFGVVGAMAMGGLNAVITQENLARRQMERLADLQRSLRLLTTDLAMVQPRYVRDELGDLQAPLVTDGRGEFLVRLSRGGWSNPAYLPMRGTLQRVQYRLEEDVLLREYWPVMDHLLGQEPRRQEILDGVEKLEILYLDPNNEWQPQWPPLRQSAAAATTMGPRPRAIRFILTLKDLGEIERLVEVVP